MELFNIRREGLLSGDESDFKNLKDQFKKDPETFKKELAKRFAARREKYKKQGGVVYHGTDYQTIKQE
ncbi:MAG: hypothetical protein IKP65_04395 [Alphaproteobacteria bacterium]|nr:hypothetical protein [Alphaproteobacteria bacterium]